MKTCRECGAEKTLDQYYKHSAMGDGHLNKCIECVKSRVKKHRDENIDRIKEYAKTEAGKLAHKKAAQNYHERYPLKKAAHYMLGNAVRDGKIKRQEFCSECGSTKKVEAHHDDYSKPFDVRWLCEVCHKEWHRHSKPKF